jgi:hypothetical protein
MLIKNLDRFARRLVIKEQAFDVLEIDHLVWSHNKSQILRSGESVGDWGLQTEK